MRMPELSTKAHLFLSDGAVEREVVVTQTPFTIGRLPDRDLVLPHPYISRNHAQLVYEDSQFYLIDQGSQSGSYLNGKRVQRQRLADDDVIHIGSPEGPRLRFRIEHTTATALRTLLGQIKDTSSSESGLGKLSWFVEAARRLNKVGAVNEILSSLIEATLELTRVERGYVFLCDTSGQPRLAAGRNIHNQPLSDDSTISHSALQQAIASRADFIVKDALSGQADGLPSHSIVAQSLRTIICIPLRRRVSDPRLPEKEILGVLYLDSQQKGKLTRIDSDLLKIVATEAAVLLENAMLVQAEEAARRYREELKIASEIQQGLMVVRIPELSYAKVNAQSVPCKDIGGDFYDVISLEDALYVVVADISGKGISAALLGATLQGLIHSQVLAGQSLSQIALFANRYICDKSVGKYATMVLLRLNAEGEGEYINCGHVLPLLQTSETVSALPNGNFPVGMIPAVSYTSDKFKVKPGERILIVTDGVTESENPAGECYGEQRLQAAVMGGADLGVLFDQVSAFTQGAPLEDDCTILEVCFAACPA